MLYCPGHECPLRAECYRHTQPSPGRDAFAVLPYNLATGTCAFVFQMHDAASEALVREVLVAPNVVKVGFDLRSDQKQLMHRLGVYAQPLLDLDFVFRARGLQHIRNLRRRGNAVG